MTSKEKDAVLVVSTIVVLALGHLVLSYNFIGIQLWQTLTFEQTLKYALLGVLVIAATAYANRLIKSHSPVMEFSLLKLIPALRRFAENIAVLPAYLYGPLAVAYMVALTYALPIIAFFEEWWFRRHIDGVLSAILVTVVFALVHFLVGASLGGSIALIIPGGFFALVYAIQKNTVDGLVAATYLHVFYDIVAVALVSYEVRQARRRLKTQAA